MNLEGSALATDHGVINTVQNLMVYSLQELAHLLENFFVLLDDMQGDIEWPLGKHHFLFVLAEELQKCVPSGG